MNEGPTVIMRELRSIRDGLKTVSFDDPHYATLRARENIIHQFGHQHQPAGAPEPVVVRQRGDGTGRRDRAVPHAVVRGVQGHDKGHGGCGEEA